MATDFVDSLLWMACRSWLLSRLNLAFLHWFVCPCLVFFLGYNSGSLNGASMHGVLAGARGPFTPSQWMELEQQALIYKYITANMPVPSNLLIPIRKALDSAGFSSFPGGLLRPNTCKFYLFRLANYKAMFCLFRQSNWQKQDLRSFLKSRLINNCCMCPPTSFLWARVCLWQLRGV